MDKPLLFFHQLTEPRRRHNIGLPHLVQVLVLLLHQLWLFHVPCFLQFFISFLSEVLQVVTPLVFKTQQLFILTPLHLVVYLTVLLLYSVLLPLNLALRDALDLLLDSLRLLKTLFLVQKTLVSIISQNFNERKNVNWRLVRNLDLSQNWKKMIECVGISLEVLVVIVETDSL